MTAEAHLLEGPARREPPDDRHRRPDAHSRPRATAEVLGDEGAAVRGALGVPLLPRLPAAVARVGIVQIVAGAELARREPDSAGVGLHELRERARAAEPHRLDRQLADRRDLHDDPHAAAVAADGVRARAAAGASCARRERSGSSSSQVFPAILIIIPLFLVLRTIQLNDTLFGLTLVYVTFTMPFTLWMLQGYIAAIPRDLEEAGEMDGAGRWRVLRSIVFPLLAPGLVATAMFTFVSAWNEFFLALVLIQSPELYTLPITLRSFLGAEGQTQLGPLAAGAVSRPSRRSSSSASFRRSSPAARSPVPSRGSSCPHHEKGTTSCGSPEASERWRSRESPHSLSAAASRAARPTTTTDDGEAVTLQFQSLSDQPATQEAVAAIVDEWNAENEDVQVEIVQAGWDGIYDKLITQFTGGTAPDIIHFEASSIVSVRAGRLPRRPQRPHRSRAQGRHLGRHLGLGDASTTRSSPIPSTMQSYMVVRQHRPARGRRGRDPHRRHHDAGRSCARSRRPRPRPTPTVSRWGLGSPTADHDEPLARDSTAASSRARGTTPRSRSARRDRRPRAHPRRWPTTTSRSTRRRSPSPDRTCSPRSTAARRP